ncbi:phytanoyl-CoA dioxygenase domain-containing protein [Rhizobium sp. N4311]|nr:phytanoyl-CoA dioxygenase domain-containing protein [Rhizobium sp. N4311]
MPSCGAIIPFDADEPRTWTQPVVRLAGYGGGPFEKAVNTPVLHSAFDQLAGKGRWEPRTGLGSSRCDFPIQTIPAMPAGMSI